ncbi:AfsR/SARP family transcriptional regulator [Plantactinospora alkalitolerans]|uniref:AfsR/SARP family transcriptional regulator n=1 Tax=Plantactinospora alkalitolerans TaxID=2789879 RepID=UPI002B1F9D0E|nr:BTAD domain-containing putative transcriptional regulator [Plantactinospora alkalitolerans]
MEFRLLGQVEAEHNGVPVALGRRGERRLLGVLLLLAGQAVTVDRLASLLWDDAPPASARTSLQAHVSRLRRRLDPDGNGTSGVRLISQHGGYGVEVDPAHVDAHRFRLAVDTARGIDDLMARSSALRSAIGLWKGPLLAGVASDRLRERVGADLIDLRLSAMELAVETDLSLGRHQKVVGELGVLAAEHPTRERFTAQLITALFRCGRQHEALDAYERLRVRLANELGVDPDPDLQRLRAALLRHDTGLRLTAGQSATPTPAQLPADILGFVGRRDALDQLDALLSTSVQEPTAVVICAMSGTAGVGKTALAVHWAHRVADRFPGGELYVNLHGFDATRSATSPTEALRGFLDALGVPPQRIPGSLDGQVCLYRSLLAGQKILVVLDNARDVDQVRPLLPSSAGCLAVVTSRNELSGLVAAQGANLLTLDPLSQPEAHHLLMRRLGAGRLAREPAAVDKIVARCAGLPLALAIVAARAATRPGFPLELLATELHDADSVLDPLAVGSADTDVRTVFSWSYRVLSPEAARLFRLLGLHPGPDVSLHAAASLAGITRQQVRPLLAELSQAHLVTEQNFGRYTLHDLLRAYAIELTRSNDDAAERRAATGRQLDHYLHTACAATRLMDPHRVAIALSPPRAGVILEDLSGADAALAWLVCERRVLLAAIHQAGAGFEAHVWQLAWAVASFLHRQGHGEDLLAVERRALDAAMRLTDPIGVAHSHNGLGLAYFVLDQEDKAQLHLEEALVAYGRIGDHGGQACAHLNLGAVLDRHGQHGAALRHAEQASTLFRMAGQRRGEARALSGIAWSRAKLGDHRSALEDCRLALTLYAQLPDRHGEAAAWDTLGSIHRQLGAYDEAVTCYQRAVRLSREAGERQREAAGLTKLGDTHQAAGDPAAAGIAWRQSLTLLAELNHPEADQVRTKLLATVNPVTS